MVTIEQGKKQSSGAKSGEARAAKARAQAEEYAELLAAGWASKEAQERLGISRVTAWRYQQGDQPARAAQPREDADMAWVALEDIHDNPYQPRTTRNAAAMEELVESIAEVGLLQTPAARYVDRWELAWGHQRRDAVRILAAAGRAEGLAWETRDGRPGMQVLRRAFSDEEMRVIALTENLKRSDLTPLEAHRAYRRYLDEVEGATIAGLAKRVGVERSTLSNGLRTLTLPAAVLDLVAEGRMAFAIARMLLVLSCPAHGMHEDLLADVLTGLENRADRDDGVFTGAWVRETLRMVALPAFHDAEGSLRLCERPGKVYAGGTPAFDVTAFVNGHQDALHVLPAARDGTTYRFTCAVEDWKKAQRAVKQDVKDNGAARLRKKWENDLRDSPQLAALRAEHKAEKLEGKATATERAALGPVGEEPVRVQNVEWAQSFRARGQHFDKGECGGCTKGARYLLQSGQLEMHCTNQACYERKDKEGMAVAKEKAKDFEAAETAQCVRIRELMEQGSPYWPQVMAITCVLMSRTSEYALYREYNDTTPEGIKYAPAPRLVLEEVTPARQRNDRNLLEAALGWTTTTTAQAGLVALILRVWQQHRRLGLDGLEETLRGGVPVSQETADADDTAG